LEILCLVGGWDGSARNERAFVTIAIVYGLDLQVSAAAAPTTTGSIRLKVDLKELRTLEEAAYQ
jgi:hypothetical protein